MRIEDILLLGIYFIGKFDETESRWLASVAGDAFFACNPHLAEPFRMHSAKRRDLTITPTLCMSLEGTMKAVAATEKRLSPTGNLTVAVQSAAVNLTPPGGMSRNYDCLLATFCKTGAVPGLKVLIEPPNRLVAI